MRIKEGAEARKRPKNWTHLSESDKQAGQRSRDIEGALVHELDQDRVQGQDPLQEVLRHQGVVVGVRMAHDGAEGVESGVEEFFVLFKMMKFVERCNLPE